MLHGPGSLLDRLSGIYLDRGAERLICHRGIPAHHLLGLPTPELYYDRRREPGVEGHRRPVVPEVVEVEVLSPAARAALRKTRLTCIRL